MSKQLLEIVGVLALAVSVVASGIWIVDVEQGYGDVGALGAQGAEQAPAARGRDVSGLRAGGLAGDEGQGTWRLTLHASQDLLAKLRGAAPVSPQVEPEVRLHRCG